MCHYITLIAPTDETAALDEVMRRHGRAATPIDNPSVRKVLGEGERQYLTTRGHCDCGSVLAGRLETAEALEERLAAEAARLKRKGWSAAKIARAVEDRRKVAARPAGTTGGDSIELWTEVLGEIRDRLGLAYAGLMVREYEGLIAAEDFTATRREVAVADCREALSAMEPDQVTIFRLPRS